MRAATRAPDFAFLLEAAPARDCLFFRETACGRGLVCLREVAGVLDLEFFGVELTDFFGCLRPATFDRTIERTVLTVARALAAVRLMAAPAREAAFLAPDRALAINFPAAGLAVLFFLVLPDFLRAVAIRFPIPFVLRLTLSMQESGPGFDRYPLSVMTTGGTAVDQSFHVDKPRASV